ncbi:hypothetical protein V6N13_075942 [Hibiscus sabdariffa]|uniref:Uncharacterized protein n=1 Tax=Hibiscus sabdariffa TaxID=183260 RepID=A0ABR2UDW6_9ROSI
MDESWRMCIGMSTTHHLPRRKSMENSIFSGNHITMVVPDHNLDLDDFSDVFGGPPRSVLCRKLSGDFTRSTSFYQEVFRPPEFISSRSTKDGRSLPAFKIPAREEGFYSDIFGSVEDHWRSRERSRSNSKAKSNSSSVLSSDELSPLRPDDVGLSSFASKLSRRATSPEIISLEPHSFPSVKISAGDFEFNSPPSPASSPCHEPVRVPSDSMHQQQEDDDDDDEDEVMSSYVIEINSDLRESNGEAISIDEAIAWANERYNTQTTSEKTQPNETEGRSNSHESFDLQMDGHGTIQSPKEDEEKKWKAKEEDRPEEHIKMGILDDDVKVWTSGKENNIQLLLSTLHQILWPSSGWNMIPLTCLKESSQVKKAYQKAILCLHPDKLQQRGATLSQKYVAEQAFTILQDAWAAFISQDVFFN